HRLDRAVEHGKEAIAAGLDQSPSMLGNRWLNQFAQQALHPNMGASLVRSHQARVARDIGHHDRGEFARAFARHGAPRHTLFWIIAEYLDVRQRAARGATRATGHPGVPPVWGRVITKPRGFLLRRPADLCPDAGPPSHKGGYR